MQHLRHTLAACLTAAVLLTSSAAAQGTPPPGYQWYQNPANGHYYAISHLEGFWEAEAEAVALGGHLATIRNQQEHDFLRPIAEQINCSSHHAGFGFTDYAVEGVWEWISGEPVTYVNWSPGEPNNLNNNEHYAIYWYGQWGDTSRGGPGSCVRSLIEWFPRGLTTDVSSISSATGGTVTFSLEFEPADAWARYKLLGSASGTGPSTIGGLQVPLTSGDWLWNAMVAFPGPSAFQNANGYLDTMGKASSTLHLPPNRASAMIGATLHFAAVLYVPATYTGLKTSNAVALTILP